MGDKIKALPAIGSKVYVESSVPPVDTDVFEGVVIEHLSGKEIQVETEDAGEKIKEVWSDWLTEEEFKAKYVNKSNG